MAFRTYTHLFSRPCFSFTKRVTSEGLWGSRLKAEKSTVARQKVHPNTFASMYLSACSKANIQATPTERPCQSPLAMKPVWIHHQTVTICPLNFRAISCTTISAYDERKVFASIGVLIFRFFQVLLNILLHYGWKPSTIKG